jgi:hypothetical protein
MDVSLIDNEQSFYVNVQANHLIHYIVIQPYVTFNT